jgi:gliding motility-associated-like protein
MEMNNTKFAKSLLAIGIGLVSYLTSNISYGHNDNSNSPVAPAEVDGKLLFSENKGQWPAEAKFRAPFGNGAAFFTNSGVVYSIHHNDDIEKYIHAYCGPEHSKHDFNDFKLRGHAYKVVFKDANSDAVIKSQGVNKQKRYENYFIGNDRSKWASNVGMFTAATFKDVYDGVDVKYYSSANNQLKYDFIVKAGHSPSQIKLNFEGDVTSTINSKGDLVISTTVGDVIEKAPFTYQNIEGKKVVVPSRYQKVGKDIIFDFPSGYNAAYDLIIDPELVFATYSTSTGSGSGMYSGTTTYDLYGNTYVGAKCYQGGWPTTLGAFQTSYTAGTDVGINKYNALGTAIVYSTYLGGSSSDVPYTLRVNNADELVVGGYTSSGNFPMVLNPFQSTIQGSQDIFLVKLSNDGTQMLGSTFLGSPNSELAYMNFPAATSMSAFSEAQMEPCAFDVIFDVFDNTWVITNTNSATWATTSNAFQLQNAGGWDGVIMKFTPGFDNLLMSTYIGGTGNEVLYSLDVFENGKLVVAGATTSTDLPTTTGVYQPAHLGGASKGFIAVINDASGALEALTYVGDASTAEQVNHVKIDKDQNIVVLGRTNSNAYPITPGVWTNNLTNANKLFLHKFNSTLTTSIRSTVIKATTGIFFPSAFTVDFCGNAYIAALKVGANMPLTADAFQTGTDDFWMGALDRNFEELIFGSYFGSTNDEDHTHTGVNRFDPQGIVYHSICGSAQTWPTTSDAIGRTRTFSGGQDIITFKFNFDKSGVSSVFEPDRLTTPMDSFCAPHTVQFVNNSTSAREFIWDFGDGSPTSNLRTPTHTYTAAGIYEVKLISINDSMCITHDTSTMYVHVYEVQEPILSVVDTNLCVAVDSLLITVNLANPSMGVPGNIFRWTSPSAGAIYGPGNTQSVWVNPNLGSQFNVTVLDSAAAVCVTSANAMVNVNMKPRTLEILTPDTAVCAGDVVQIRARGSAGYTYRWSPTTGINNPNSLEPIITINQSQLYMVTASYPFCIDTSDMISIVMHEYPAVTIQAPNEACEGSEVEFTSSVTPYRNDYIYEWTPANLFTNNGLPNVSMIADTIDRQYGLKVSTPIGCSDSTAKIVIFHTKGNGDAISGVDYCAPGSAQLWASNGVSYEWSPQLGLDDPYSANPVTSTSTPIDYSVFITDEHGCIDTLQVVVDVHPRAMLSLPDSVTVYQGGSGYQVLPQTNAMYFEWFPQAGVSNPNLSDPVLNPIVNTRYIVTAKTEFGCEVVDSMDVVVGPAALNMPNAYNPNNPEAPLYKAVIKGGWELKSFKIYNRWGKLLFETSDLNEGWDGRYNNEPQPMGVYVWGIEAISKEGETISNSGNVTLIR